MPTITASEKADEKWLSSLKGHLCTAVIGAQADGHTTMSKAIAECIGRVHGNKMHQLALSGKESTQIEPAHPDGMTATKKDKAIWSEQIHPQNRRHNTKIRRQKAKVFTIVFGQCNKAMKNQVEANSSHLLIESKNNVAALLQVIKGMVCDDNEKECLTQQATTVFGGLMMAPQQDEEDHVDCHKRFMSLNEMADKALGKVAPVAVAKKNMTAHGKDPSGTQLAEKN